MIANDISPVGGKDEGRILVGTLGNVPRLEFNLWEFNSVLL